MTGEWLLLRCSCGNSFGSGRGSQAKCTRCGTRGGRVVDTFADPALLAEAVAAANVPKEIARELSQRTSKKPLRVDAPNTLPATSQLRNAMLSATTEDGTLSASSLRERLSSLGLDRPTAEQLIEQAEYEGALVRDGPGTWSWLQQSS